VPAKFVTLLLLLTVTFVPFPTAVLAAHLGTPEARTAVAFYCGTFVVNALAWNLLFQSMVRNRLLHAEVTAQTIANVRRAYFYGALIYLAATLIALVQPIAGLLVNVSLWILWIRLGYRAERGIR
jgi:uncharacterized membrane protein